MSAPVTPEQRAAALRELARGLGEAATWPGLTRTQRASLQSHATHTAEIAVAVGQAEAEPVTAPEGRFFARMGDRHAV